MSLSGIDEMVDATPGQIERLAGEALLTAENPEAEKALMQPMLKAWDRQAIRVSIQNYLREVSSPEEISALLEWKTSPLAKRMLSAELQSHTPDFQERLARYVETLATDPPNEATMQAISRLVAEAELVDMYGWNPLCRRRGR